MNTIPDHPIMQSLTNHALFGLVLAIGVYLAFHRLNRRFPFPFLNPLLLSIITISPSEALETASRRRPHTPAFRQRAKRLCCVSVCSSDKLLRIGGLRGSCLQFSRLSLQWLSTP